MFWTNSAGFRIISKPSILPIRRITKMEAIITTRPIRELKIFFLAVSSAPLSPLEDIIDIAADMKLKMNQIAAIIVKNPIVPDIN